MFRARILQRASSLLGSNPEKMAESSNTGKPCVARGQADEQTAKQRGNPAAAPGTSHSIHLIHVDVLHSPLFCVRAAGWRRGDACLVPRCAALAFSPAIDHVPRSTPGFPTR